MLYKMSLKNKLYNLLKCFYSWVNEMTQWIRKLAAKSEDLSLIPGTHSVEELVLTSSAELVL